MTFLNNLKRAAVEHPYKFALSLIVFTTMLFALKWSLDVSKDQSESEKRQGGAHPPPPESEWHHRSESEKLQGGAHPMPPESTWHRPGLEPMPDQIDFTIDLLLPKLNETEQETLQAMKFAVTYEKLCDLEDILNCSSSDSRRLRNVMPHFSKFMKENDGVVATWYNVKEEHGYHSNLYMTKYHPDSAYINEHPVTSWDSYDPERVTNPSQIDVIAYTASQQPVSLVLRKRNIAGKMEDGYIQFNRQPQVEQLWQIMLHK